MCQSTWVLNILCPILLVFLYNTILSWLFLKFILNVYLCILSRKFFFPFLNKPFNIYIYEIYYKFLYLMKGFLLICFAAIITKFLWEIHFYRPCMWCIKSHFCHIFIYFLISTKDYLLFKHVVIPHLSYLGIFILFLTFIHHNEIIED